jgi:glycosyltransferase involved in cell wall biosynthesis
MPTYNSGKYISQAIRSILNQTFNDFEFLIIDDGSIDNTEEIVKSIKDSRILYKKIYHKGISEALNYGISLASGEWIARMDSDDISAENRLEKQYNYLRTNPETVICSSYYNLITDNGRFIGVRKLPVTDIEIKEVIEKWSPFCHPSVVFKKEIALKSGGYPNAKGIEDWELWKNLVRYGKAYNIPDTLLNYRIRNDSVSSLNESDAASKTHKVNSEADESFYNLRVGISFLENGKNKKQARYYIRKSFSVNFNIKYFYNYLLTYLPFTFIYFFKSLKKGFAYAKYIRQ